MNSHIEALTLVDQLRSNADAHRESGGTERRRAADCIERLVEELDALYPRWAAMTGERSDWQLRALAAEEKLRGIQNAPNELENIT
jgi:hypothetical protein